MRAKPTGLRAIVRALAVVTAAAGATVLMTWPVARQATDHLVVPRDFIGKGLLPTSPDTYLHLWILAWVHHALTRWPTRLFDASIMYPAHNALAGSEHMLAHWPLYAPVSALSGNPVLAYQWILLSSFVLNAVALWILVRRWTESAPAAAVGAFVYAFVPLRFDLIGTVQHLNVAYLPALVLFADAYRRDGRGRDLVGVACATAVQALCSYYLAYATVVALGVLCAAVALGGGERPWRRAGALGAAGIVGLVPLAAVSGPYLALRAAALVPTYPVVWLRRAAARPGWLVQPGLPIFAGHLPLALALVGVVAARLSRWRRGVALAIAAVGFVLALGPVVSVFGVDVPLPYGVLYAAVPGFSALRYPYRFGTLLALGLAVLAGAGWGRLVGERRLRWPLTAVALAAIALEYWQAPLAMVAVETGDAVPAVYRWLADHGDGRPVLEWPVAPPGDMRAGYQESRAMYFQTYHWQPLVNGYTAYEPPSHAVVSLLAQRLPDRASARDLLDLTGVRLLLLHRDRLDPDARERWNAWLAGGDCERLVESGPDVLCGLPPPVSDLRARLVAADARVPDATFRSLPLAPLEPDGRRGTLALASPRTAMAAGLVQRIRLQASNRSVAPWPGLAPLVPGVVTIRHRFERDGDAAGDWVATPLLCDVPPGGACNAVLPVTAPLAPGAYVLAIDLAQEDGPPLALEDGPLRVPVEVVAFGGARGAR